MPRISRSTSASWKPSPVWASASSRGFPASPKRMHSPGSVPRPMRPRSWWSCESPYRSAASTIITVAFGTSMPTSITLVATSTPASPPANAAIASAFRFELICPWISSTRWSLNSVAWRCSASVVAARACSASDSSTSGQTTNTCRPRAISSRARS